MAYGRAGKTDEVTQLRDEITHEVNTDAEHLARDIFPRKGQQPDMQRVGNETIDARYRRAYLENDRQWLTSEAQRDPEQFIDVVRRIGVMLPEEIGQDQAMAPPPMPMPQPTPVPVTPALTPPPPVVPSAGALPLAGPPPIPGQPVAPTVPPAPGF